MKKTEEEYCKIINNSLLFYIEDKTSDEYVSEFRYLQKQISDYYYYCVWVNKEVYGIELIVAFRDCVKSYNKEAGNFVNYLSVAVSKNRKIAIAKEQSARTRGGIKVQVREERQIRYLNSIVMNKGWNLEDWDISQKLASALELSQEKVEYLLEINRQAMALRESIELDDSEVSLYDQVSDNITPESILLDTEKLVGVLERLNKIVALQSGGKRKIISIIITSMLVNFDIDESLSTDELEKFCFFDSGLYAELRGSRKVYSDSDIAKRLNVSKSYISKVRKATFVNL